MAELFGSLGIALWSVFFLVPVGRGLHEQRIAPEEYERVFDRLWHHARRQPYAIKTTEAPHYRRFVLERGGDPHFGRGMARPGRPARLPLGVGDGRGIAFVSHVGQIFPSGFLPLEAGRFPTDSIVGVYQRSPVFTSLRRPDLLEGKCGACEYRTICGGSRARAFALTRNPLAAEPDCAYIPRTWRSADGAGSPTGSAPVGAAI
jgi:MoaA/NifB/PqqE/SkfB family radical SAM enzyme